ncbi:EAL domain-containing protein [Paenibacillus sp. TRM 82003]|nr:EAL domain-containing protein [Paenibacillus sp. TRM 82003]
MNFPYQPVILLVAYGLPILFVADTMMQILRRNLSHSENRLAAITTISLGLALLCQYVIHISPVQYATDLYTYVNYPLIFLVANNGVLFYMKITGLTCRLSWPVSVFIAYSPLLLYTALLLGFGGEFLFQPATTDGAFHRDQPAGPFYWVFLLLAFITSLTGVFCYWAWKAARLTAERKRFEALLKANLYCLGAILGIYGLIMTTPIPDSFSWLLGAIWPISLKVYVKYDFLPSVERKFELLHDLSPTAIVLLDRAMTMKDLNPAAKRLLGIDAADSHGWQDREFLEFLPPEDRIPLREAFRQSFPRREWTNRELTIVNRRGQERIVLVDTGIMPHGNDWFVLAVARDISERKAEERHVSYLAHHDTLTGLPNRLLYQRRLEEALEEAYKSGTSLAVMLIDLDRFKLINDTLGHHYGDRALVEVSRRLQAAIGDPGSTLLARLGGDEFILLRSGAAEPGSTEWLGERILQAFAQPVALEGQLYYLGASVGISVYPRDGGDKESLIKKADIAMYHAKHAGGQRCCHFSDGMLEPVQRDVELIRRLHQALAKEEFVIHYQPQVDLSSGEIIGAEALIRWNAEGTGMIPPGDFIPLAEQTGLIEPIGRWALREVCRKGKLWQDAGLEHFVLSVNISPKQFLQPDFSRMITQTLQSTGLEPSRLCLEITESMVVHNLQAARDMLGELAALGIRIAIDDFGTGYSSLSVVGQLPIDTIKIDRSFIAGLDKGPSGIALVRAMISMGHDLGKRIVAEGVETAGQLRILTELSCETAQGFYYYKPMPAERIDEFLRPTLREAK